MAGKAKQKEYYDKKASPPPLQAGDYVWYHDKKGYMSSKLIKRWKGVFIIKQRNLTATSQCCDHPDLPTLRVHVNMLQLHIGLSVKGELTDISIDLSEADPPSPEQPRVDSSQPEPPAEKTSKESFAHKSDDKEKNPRVSTFWGGSSQLPNRLIVTPEECKKAYPECFKEDGTSPSLEYLQQKRERLASPKPRVIQYREHNSAIDMEEMREFDPNFQLKEVSPAEWIKVMPHPETANEHEEAPPNGRDETIRETDDSPGKPTAMNQPFEKHSTEGTTK